MKKIILVMCVVALLVCPVTAAGYSGGAGTEADPYQITTETDLNTLAASPDDWASHFVVMNDITFTAASMNVIGVMGENEESSAPFAGTFNGGGNTISNFTMNLPDTDFVGFFGVIVDGTVLNLTITTGSAGVCGNRMVGILVGGLVGGNAGTITQCHAAGDVICINSNGGGLVGFNMGTVTNCFATGNATATTNAGGLVGYTDGTVTNCYATGNATATTNAGGLVGLNIGSITNCYATGNATAEYDYAGGLVGLNIGSITNCYATGIATGGDTIGGLVGRNNEGTITDGYRVQSTGTDVGTIISDLSKFKDIDWLTGTTPNDGLNWSADIISTEADDTKIWFVKSDKSVYPMFQWQSDDEPVTKYSGGEGTEASPYQIETETDLNTLAASPDDWASHFVVMNDITFTAASTNTIGKGNTYDEDWVIIEEGVPFEGVFDGNRKTISNFEIDKTVSESIGLFGVVGENGKILGLTVNSSDFGVHGGSNVGILVGANSGNILNCYSTGDAIGGGSVGGLVGICEGGTITNCHATASVTTHSGVITGGLVGLNFGSITNCYATGNATAEYDYAGGLVGLNIGSITNCYATGIATGGDTIGGLVGENSGSITNCYATGIATGGDTIGGLVGYNSGTVTNCYATGNATATTNAGGLVGSNYDTITNCYRFSDLGETKDGILITDLSKFKDIDWLTGTTPNDGLKWSENIISTEKDGTKIWGVDPSKAFYPVFQHQYTPATPTPTPTPPRTSTPTPTITPNPTPTQKPPVVHNRDRRAMATPSTYEIDESGYNMLLSSLELDQEFNSTTKEGELHPRGVFDASVFPFTGGAFGEYAAFLIFAIPFVLAWMRQNSAIIPMSFGCVLGTWMLWKLPAEWQLPATGLIVLSMMVILYGVYKEKY